MKKKIKNPLIKRIPKELRDEFKSKFDKSFTKTFDEQFTTQVEAQLAQAGMDEQMIAAMLPDAVEQAKQNGTSDCLTIRKFSLMYGIFIFDFFNTIFIFVFHMNYICSSPCYFTLSSNFVTNSSVENMLNNRLKL